MSATNAINWQDCVKQSNNKPELAQELLDMFALELPTLKQQINLSHKNNDLSTLEYHVHKLHGACCYCGTNRLKLILHDLEKNISRLQPAQLDTQIQTVRLEIDRIIHSLQSKDYR